MAGVLIGLGIGSVIGLVGAALLCSARLNEGDNWDWIPDVKEVDDGADHDEAL